MKTLQTVFTASTFVYMFLGIFSHIEAKSFRDDIFNYIRDLSGTVKYVEIYLDCFAGMGIALTLLGLEAQLFVTTGNELLLKFFVVLNGVFVGGYLLYAVLMMSESSTGGHKFGFVGVVDSVKFSVENYDADKDVGKAMDYIQNNLNCCGSTNSNDYWRKRWFTPLSCCKKFIPYTFNTLCMSDHSAGCAKELFSITHGTVLKTSYIAFAIAAFQIFVGIVVYCMYLTDTEEYDEEVDNESSL